MITQGPGPWKCICLEFPLENSMLYYTVEHFELIYYSVFHLYKGYWPLMEHMDAQNSATHNSNVQQPGTGKMQNASYRLSALTKASAQLHWFTALDGTIQENCAEWQAFTGQTPEEYQDHGWLQALHPVDREPLQQVREQSIQTGQCYDIECRIRRHDGLYRTLLVKSIPVQDGNDSTYEWMGCASDITEQKHLRQFQEEHYHLAMEAAEIGLWDWDLNNDHLVWDDQCKSLFGLPASIAMNYEHFINAIHTDDRATVDQLVLRALHENADYDAQFRVVWPDTSIHWIASKGRVSFDQQATPQRMIGVAQDITRTKMIEADLQASEINFRRLFESNIIGILVGDQQGTILEANDAFLSMMGYTREELATGQLNWHTITPPNWHQQDLQALKTLQENGTLPVYEKEYVTKQGRRFPGLIAAARLEDTTHRYIAYIIDISAQKELDQQKDTLISVVGHELRTPLTSIKGNLQLALRHLQKITRIDDTLPVQVQQASHDATERLERALRQIGLQNRLINDLLDVTRIASNKLELTPHLCDLISIVYESVQDLHSTFPSRDIQIHLPQDIETLMVLADSDRIGQVVTNYITNALKYAPSHESILVGITLEQTQARVWVQDKGPGLTQDAQQRIWERLYQARDIPVQSGPGAGLGLGLYICRTLIQRHNGMVGVDSTPGQGSTFWFTLPLAETIITSH